MTPYAVLLLTPRDSDDVVRAAFHALSRDQHPDRDGADGVPGTMWYAIVNAYTALKTTSSRAVYDRALKSLAGVCSTCGGYGTVGTRRFKGTIRLCTTCKGEGRVKR
jgi:DnaJ-class molecular chaperone